VVGIDKPVYQAIDDLARTIRALYAVDTHMSRQTIAKPAEFPVAPSYD
jgi:hypothetical protein